MKTVTLFQDASEMLEDEDFQAFANSGSYKSFALNQILGKAQKAQIRGIENMGEMEAKTYLAQIVASYELLSVQSVVSQNEDMEDGGLVEPEIY